MPKKLTVHVDESPVGVGKTYNALHRAIHYPSRSIFAVERIASVVEIERRAKSMASTQGSRVSIRTITSSDRNRGESVATEIAALPGQFANRACHVLVIITHAALMMSNMTNFHDWHIVIDEVPSVLVQETLKTQTDHEFFERKYSLTPLAGNWAEVRLTEAGTDLRPSDMSDCQSHAYLKVFHQRVAGSLRPVVCDLSAWADMARPDAAWTWWSIFSVRELEAFATITFLGSGFTDRVAAKMLKALDTDTDWKVSSNAGNRRPKAKTVRVHYFTNQFASRYYFESEHGQRHLGQIGNFLSEVMPSGSIWSANNPPNRPCTAYSALAPHMGSLAYLPPRQAGTDDLMHHRHAAMIYSAKPSPASKAILGFLSCTEADWIETNEFETILQFLTRTNVRDVTVGGDTDLYVLSKDQADYLMAFFHSQPHIAATLYRVDLGFEYPPPGKRGPKPRSLSPAETAQRATAIKAAKAHRERARRAQLKLAKASATPSR